MKEQRPDLDLVHARCALLSNKKNSVTSHYELLLKKKLLMHETLSDFSEERKEVLVPIATGKQVRDHHSIPAAPRHNLLHRPPENFARYGYQLKKNPNLQNIALSNQREPTQVSTAQTSLSRPDTLKNTVQRKNIEQITTL